MLILNIQSVFHMSMASQHEQNNLQKFLHYKEHFEVSGICIDIRTQCDKIILHTGKKKERSVHRQRDKQLKFDCATSPPVSEGHRTMLS